MNRRDLVRGDSLNDALALPTRTAWALAACPAAGTVCAQSLESDVTPEFEYLVKEAARYAISADRQLGDHR
jgi:hypothetical protein